MQRRREIQYTVPYLGIIGARRRAWHARLVTCHGRFRPFDGLEVDAFHPSVHDEASDSV